MVLLSWWLCAQLPCLHILLSISTINSSTAFRSHSGRSEHFSRIWLISLKASAKRFSAFKASARYQLRRYVYLENCHSLKYSINRSNSRIAWWGCRSYCFLFFWHWLRNAKLSQFRRIQQDSCLWDYLDLNRSFLPFELQNHCPQRYQHWRNCFPQTIPQTLR